MRLEAAAALLFVWCSKDGGAMSPLLSAADLEQAVGGTWQVEQTTLREPAGFTACGRAVPSRDGRVTDDRTALMSEASLVEHELVTYADVESARDAVEALARLPVTCPRYERRDADGDVRVEVRTLPVDGTQVAVEFLATYAAGGGAGWVVTAVREGKTVSYVSVSAVDEGIPTAEYVATIVAIDPG